MKVLLICSKSSVVIDFRKKLIEKLQSMGHQVVAIAFDRQNEEEIVRRGVEFHCCADANRPTNSSGPTSTRHSSTQSGR